MKNDKELVTLPIPMLIRRISVPASVGLFFYTMYNVVDTYFGGLISTQALAAMSLSLPVFFVIISVGSGLATGTTALIGSALGGGHREEARLFAVQGVSFCLVISVVLTFAGFRVTPFLFSILGASGEYMDICRSYMDTLFKGFVFFMLVHMFNGILNSVGDTRSHRNFLIAGFLMNVVLDPWFIYGGMGLRGMGFVGIPVATVVVQIVGSAYLGFKAWKTGLLSDISPKDFLPKLFPFKEIARQGFPAALNVMTIAMGVFVITYFISGFGEAAVAAYGVGTRVEQIVLIPVIGLNVGTLTLVAQNSGARQYDRVFETLNTALRYGGVLMAAGALAVLVFAEPFMALFSKDPEVVRIGVSYLRVDALALYAYIILFVSVAALQGVKRPMFAVVIGLSRQILAPVAVFWLFTRVLDFGLPGIWWGIFLVTWSAALVALFYSRWVLRGMAERDAESGR